MSHRKLWVLGIVSLLMISTISPSHAEDDDNVTTEIRAGKVSIIRDADGNTQIQTDRINIKSEPLKVRNSSRYRHRTRIRQRPIDRAAVIRKQSVETSVDSEVTTRQTSDSSVSTFSNTQVTKIRGNNRTVIQSSTDER
jgi:hypothetical protein